MPLSPNFTWREFACPCCGASRVHRSLVDGLEQLRTIVGKPIKITSGYRCAVHNSRLPGSAKDSQHLEGKAADIEVEGLTVKELLAAAEQVPAFGQGGIGAYRDGHLHVDVRGTRARW